MVKHVEIINKKNLTLRGYLHLPENATTIVVMFHGFTGHRMEHNGHFRTMARRLEKQGIASLRVDYHGNGESDGEFYDFDFDYLLEDGKQLIAYAKTVVGIKKVAVLGFSLGGAVAGLIVNDFNIDKLLLWSPAGSMVEITKSRYERLRKLENGNAYFSGFQLSKNFVDTIAKYDMYQHVDSFTKEVLIIHGSKDLSVPIEFGKKYHRLYKNSQMHVIEGAGHGYDEYEQAEELYIKSLNFLEKI